MPKVTFHFQDYGKGQDVIDIKYKSKKLKINVVEERYTDKMVELNPHLKGKITNYIVIKFKNTSEEEFESITKELMIRERKRIGICSLIIDSEKQTIKDLASIQIHNLLGDLFSMGLLKYYYKEYTINPLIPNNGLPMYANAPLHKIPYNAVQVLRLYIKRKLLCREHNFVKLHEYTSYCSHCGAKKYPEENKVDWYFN